MTRHKLFQMPYGYILIDTENESTPQGFTGGPFDVNMAKSELIAEGKARVDFNDDGTIIILELPTEEN